jgi:hypothetical protein
MQILEGHFSADDSARLCRNYRYACERMTRIMAGWMALTPELSAKLVLGGSLTLARQLLSLRHLQRRCTYSCCRQKLPSAY